jgi:hypothetical protein
MGLYDPLRLTSWLSWPVIVFSVVFSISRSRRPLHRTVVKTKIGQYLGTYIYFGVGHSRTHYEYYWKFHKHDFEEGPPCFDRHAPCFRY